MADLRGRSTVTLNISRAEYDTIVQEAHTLGIAESEFIVGLITGTFPERLKCADNDTVHKTVIIPDEVHEILREKAFKEKRTKTDIVREAIRRYKKESDA